MHLLEYQAKRICANYGLISPAGTVVKSVAEAAREADRLGYPVVLKAQVPCGGRGKAGAVRKVESAGQLAPEFHSLMSSAVQGYVPEMVLVEAWCVCESEAYLSELIDPITGETVVLLRAGGGVDVETDPTPPVKVTVDRRWGLSESMIRSACYRAGIARRVMRGVARAAESIHRVFTEQEAALVEVNPLGITSDGRAIALDVRLLVDDGSVFRRPDLMALFEEMVPKDTSDFYRFHHRLEYVPMDGSIGLISGGAGMTMAVMDLIADAGGKPGCFLDCSQSATLDGYSVAVRTLMGRTDVEAILVNIVGGGTQMDKVATAFVEILTGEQVTKPVVIRLEGTNAEEARDILKKGGIKTFVSLEEAVQVVVSMTKPRAVTINGHLA